MVSAVVLAYNRCEEVLITIDKLKVLSSTLPFDFEIIIVDNACIDNTASEVSVKHPDVTLVRIEKNIAIAGWNEGFKVAKHKYLLVLDDDSHLESGLIEAITYLEQYSNIGILALNVTTGPYQTKDWKWKDKEDISAFFGCGAIISRTLYEKIGGFAAWLYLYSHEWEYSLRANDKGYKTQYFENSNVIHRASSVNRSVKRLRVYCARNEMAIVYKYFGSNKWLYMLRICFNHLKFLKIGAYRHTYYSFVGIKEFFKMKNTLTCTPVSKSAQDFFAQNNENTRPFFANMINRLKERSHE